MILSTKTWSYHRRQKLDTQDPIFEDRKDSVPLGGFNFKHSPNVDYVKELWPRIRERLPHARMHVYGAYLTPRILYMHDEKSGFIVHGQVDDLTDIDRHWISNNLCK